MGTPTPNLWSEASKLALQEYVDNQLLQNENILKDSIKTRISGGQEDVLPPRFHVRIIYSMTDNDEIQHMDSVYKVDFGPLARTPENANLVKIFEIEYMPPKKLVDFSYMGKIPYVQGIYQNIMCRQGFEKVIKNSDNSPACVQPKSVSKLIERGWAELGNLTQIDESQKLSDEYFEQILPLDSSLRLIDIQFALEERNMITAVQDYHGSEKLITILEALRENIEKKYSKEILLHPDTEMGWHGYPGDYRTQKIYDVYFTIQTPNDKSEYFWNIGIISERVAPTNGIYFDNQEAIDIFYIVTDEEFKIKCENANGQWNQKFRNCSNIDIQVCLDIDGGVDCMSSEQKGHGRDVCIVVCEFSPLTQTKMDKELRELYE